MSVATQIFLWSAAVLGYCAFAGFIGGWSYKWFDTRCRMTKEGDIWSAIGCAMIWPIMLPALFFVNLGMKTFARTEARGKK